MDNITDLMLVNLTVGEKKDGNGKWFKGTFFAHNSKGKGVTADIFLTPDVGERMIKDGITEQTQCNVGFAFDDYLRPVITSVTRATTPIISKD